MAFLYLYQCISYSAVKQINNAGQKDAPASLEDTIISSIKQGKEYASPDGTFIFADESKLSNYIKPKALQEEVLRKFTIPDNFGTTIRMLKGTDGQLTLVLDPKEYGKLIQTGKYKPVSLVLIKRECLTGKCEYPLRTIIDHELVHAKQDFPALLKIMEGLENIVDRNTAGTKETESIKDDLSILVTELKATIEGELAYCLSVKDFKKAAKIMFALNGAFAILNKLIAVSKEDKEPLQRLKRSLIIQEKIDAAGINRSLEGRLPKAFMLDTDYTHEKLQSDAANNCGIYTEWLPELAVKCAVSR